jgi:hemerythrin
MPLIEWSPLLSVGVGRFDREHQKLINLINELHEAVGTGREREVVASVLRELVEYARTHLSNEEACLLLHGYADYPRHLAQHEGLRRSLSELFERFEREAATATDLMIFLRTWLLDHIVSSDSLYGEHLRSKGVD